MGLTDVVRGVALKARRVFFKGGAKRLQQERVDVHRLFLFTSLHEAQQQQGGHLPEGFSEQLIHAAQTLPFEQQQAAVQAQLRGQLTAIARAMHSCLQQHHDAMPAATALQQAWRHMHPPPASAAGSADSSSSSSSGRSLVGFGGAADSDGSPTASSSSSSSSSSSGRRRQLMSQQQLGAALQQQLGYSLAVRPSLVMHQDAGLGLFVEGHVPAGALVALFPGVVYAREVYRRMPNYPWIDRGNPYLTCRYDGRIIDSLPWGRGWGGSNSAAAAAAAEVVAPPRVGLVGRMALASDGPRLPVPDTTWVKATTGEAAALELLEGRNPLAMAHYANHPGPGARPNTAIASFSFQPAGCAGLQQQAQQQPATAAADGADSTQQEPWVRAYVPNLDYTLKCDHQHLLTHEVTCVGLVAVEPLAPGTEVLFNYRLSPRVMGRPAWYTPVDSEEESMRWA